MVRAHRLCIAGTADRHRHGLGGGGAVPGHSRWHPPVHARLFARTSFATGPTHYTDQAALFVQHRLKPAHFWREDVLANAASRITVTHRPNR
jgi:hypothetical protein